jgi:CDP-diacylglycerol pyrophosphatase
MCLAARTIAKGAARMYVENKSGNAVRERRRSHQKGVGKTGRISLQHIHIECILSQKRKKYEAKTKEIRERMGRPARRKNSATRAQDQREAIETL